MVDDQPIYRQIAGDLCAAIEAGEYEPGARLPSEVELMSRYGVAHGTVRDAMALLKGEGVVHSEHGRGVYVNTRQPGPMRDLVAAREARGVTRAEIAKQMGCLLFDVTAIEMGDPPMSLVRQYALAIGVEVRYTVHRASFGMPSPDWWTAADCGRFLGIGESTWRSYVSREGAPRPYRRLGRTPVWQPEAVKAWARERPRRPTKGE